MTDKEFYERQWEQSVGCLHGCLGSVIVVMMVLACVLLASCKQTEYVTVEKVRTDTLVKTNHVRESIYLHDSTAVSFNGDTVFVDRWHNENTRIEVHDTVYQSKTDSVLVPVPYPVTEYVEKELTAWQKIRMGIGTGTLLVLAVAAGVWVYRKKRQC